MIHKAAGKPASATRNPVTEWMPPSKPSKRPRMAKPGPKGISKEIKKRLAKAFLKGLSYREAAKYAGCGASTAKRHGKDMAYKCSCGQPRSFHTAWCPEKFKRSLRRQAFMILWQRSRAVRAGRFKRGSNKNPLAKETDRA